MSNISFRPVYGPEAKILALKYYDGCIYYATDTKKIYLDINGQSKVSMGGSSSVHYGKMVLIDPPDFSQKEFDFSIFDIEGNDEENIDRLTVPNVNDLILNIPDGCFYRVLGLRNDNEQIVIETIKLTIAGSGAQGPDSPSIPTGTYTYNNITAKNTKALYGDSKKIKFYFSATDANGNPTGDAIYKIQRNGIEKESGIISQGENELEVSPYLDLGANEIRITLSMDIGGEKLTSAGYTWNVFTTQMQLNWNIKEDENDEIPIYDVDQPFRLSWSVSGTDILKTTYLEIDDTHFLELTTDETTSKQYYTIQNPREYNLIHGVHKFAMRAGSKISEDKEMDYTPYIYQNLIFEENEKNVPIIQMDLFETELIQYNTIEIPVYFYSKDNIDMGNATLILKEDGIIKDTWHNVKNKEKRIWNYTPTDSGMHILSIHYGTAEFPKTINIKKVNINNSEVPDYAFKFKAANFASNTAVEEWESNGIKASFSNFDWINGGLKSEEDEDGGKRQYLDIKAGSSMTIDYPLWEKNAPGFGKTLKVIFKTANCRDYDAQAISCKIDKKDIFVDKDIEYLKQIDNQSELRYSKNLFLNNEILTLKEEQNAIFDLDDEDSRTIFENAYVEFEDGIYECHFLEVEKVNEDDPTLYYSIWYKVFVIDSFEGVVFNAQNATIKTRNNSLTTQYCEDAYMELEFNISKIDVNNKIKNYITFWVDGVPAGYVIYNENDDFVGPKSTKIAIGSQDCDVHIYMIKLYEKSLSDDEHLDNFIFDAPNAEEMIRRYNRNNILSKERQGEIDPILLAQNNPDCLVHVYEIPRMTKTKKDPVYPCTYDQYHGSKQIKYHAENVMIKVQGTSSEKYVVSAANIDTDFQYSENGNIPTGLMEVETGEVMTDGWSMDDGTAIPVNYTCTKVNVASCENANNVLNQEWYNLFQPYKTVLRCKNPRARDTMQFTNGVLFMKDHNTTFKLGAMDDKKNNNLFGEVPGYIKDPYAKMYSLANMGNSKDNIHVFHDTSNPLECCIEVKDNQTQQQQMISDIYNKTDIGEGEDYFEFRYPDGVKNASQEMIDGWNRFVSWMAHSNPSPKYQKHEARTEKEYKNFSYNPKTRQDVPVYILNEEQTEYIQIENFNPEILEYYTETEHLYGYTNLKLPESLSEEERSFKPYRFKGYRAENQVREDGSLWQKDYTPLIKDFEISTYSTYKTGENRPYTHDTYEYRMAKMLNECEDYLVMDSVLYHYLFIERHCMIDNVAKNTFWSTEDCIHWNLTKDYDNDTADGNDNNGKFTRTYGMEPLDKLNINTHVFNAHQSVWLNFIHGLDEANKHLYQKLEERKIEYKGRTLSVWSPDDYLWLFKKWQSIIPERCWIVDYRRKYFRPYELYSDTMFSEMMEGGQKKYQRQQYEKYQGIYISSKYDSLDNKNYIWVRPSGTNLQGHELPVQTYSDCYVTVNVGSDTFKKRVKRNTFENVICPVSSVGSATMDLRPLNSLTVIGKVDGGQLGDYGPEVFGFTGAGKLRELVIATKDSTSRIPGLTQLSLEGAPLLEKLYACHLTSSEIDLDLSKCPSLLELDVSNSAFTGISIADNAPVKSITLEKPSSLKLSNLTKLNNLTINNYSILEGFDIHNIDESHVNSKNILEAAINGAISEDYELEYTLTKVDWNMNKAEDIVYVDNKPRIALLEYLLNDSQTNWNDAKTERESPSISLTGNLTIGAEAYSNNDSIEIYDYYSHKDRYPNLNINFTSPNAKLYSVDIYNGNNEICWTRKLNENSLIDEAFLSGGPLGAFNIDKILKSPSPGEIYTFMKSWGVYKKEDLKNKIDTIETEIPYYDFNNLEEMCDIVLIPDFDTQTRTYELKFYGEDTNNPLMTLSDIPFGTSFNNVLELLTEIPYKEYNGTQLKTAYDFVGYALLKNSQTKVPTNYTVTNNQSFYAIFILVEDITTVIHEEWFNFEPTTYSEKNYVEKGYLSSANMVNYTEKNSYYRISPKVTLKGKITIPAQYNGKPIIAMENFSSFNTKLEQQITHIFFEKNSQLCKIESSAFRELTTLKYFDFTQNTVRFIDTYAFRQCSNLDASLNLFQLSSQLWYVGEYAFSGALSSTESTIIQIPSSVIFIGPKAFAYLNTLGTSVLQIGSQQQKSNFKFSNLELAYGNFDTSTIELFRQNNGKGFNQVDFYTDTYTSESNEVTFSNGFTFKIYKAFYSDNGPLITINFYKGDN